MRVSLEFEEGKAAYADGVDGYAATPYPECTQQMTDWFAGWVEARNADLNGEQAKKLKTFTFFIEGLNVERSAIAETVKQARDSIWLGLSEDQKNRVAYFDCIDEVAA